VSRADDDPSTFTLKRVQAMLGLSRTVLDGLIAEGFVSPARGRRNELRFTFQDLMLLRTAHALQTSKIPPRRILRSLARLKANLPDALPLTGLRISAIGADVAVRDRSGQWQADSGQLLMDFDVEPVGGELAFIEHTALAAAPAPAPGADADAATWFTRGEALEADDPVGAEAAYQRALVLAPDLAAAYLNLGAMWAEAGRFAELAALSEQAAVHCPDNALIHFNRGVALDHLERLPEALASYEHSLRLDPTLADAHYNLGRLREQLGDARGALRNFSAYRRLQRQ
jgi:tetratricopeptide (TPR) repeat protein